MKIILLENVDKLGKAGDVVNVANGFARNYLLPRKYAIPASANNLKRLDSIKEEADKKAEEATAKLKQIASTLEGVELTFSRRADEEGNLFGSVSNVDIQKELEAKGFDVHKSMIKGDVHHKALGEYEVEVAFTSEIVSKIKIIVSKEE
ncbi:MAG: 50S ribosomal protein L9 [Candidatus Cloacimonas sp.]|nr:50S ribosomal protein L9 [Candidatus Cloacimonadota bacterium]